MSDDRFTPEQKAIDEAGQAGRPAGYGKAAGPGASSPSRRVQRAVTWPATAADGEHPGPAAALTPCRRYVDKPTVTAEEIEQFMKKLEKKK